MMKWTDENIKSFWDYESNFEENYFTYQVGKKVVEYFEKLLKDKYSILDFGCGPGFLVGHLLSLDINVYGVDFSDSTIEK